MEKYFMIKAKCGHVGKRCYYEGTFFEKAKNAKTASAIVRQHGRVKRDHKDAILSVAEITFEDYRQGKKASSKEVYFQCRNIQEQNRMWQSIVINVKPETIEEPSKKEEAQKAVYDGKSRVRHPKRYIRMFELSKKYSFGTRASGWR